MVTRDDIDTRPASQGPRTAGGRAAEHNIIAEAPDLGAARHAIEQLGIAGIEADKVSLTGPAADEAAEQTETAGADRNLLTYVGLWVGTASLAGTVMGALGGGLLAIAIANDPSGGLVLLCALTGADGLGIAGGLIGGAFKVHPSQPWLLTFYDTDTSVSFIGVHSSKQDDVDRAEGVLPKLGFRAIRRFGSSHEVPPRQDYATRRPRTATRSRSGTTTSRRRASSGPASAPRSTRRTWKRQTNLPPRRANTKPAHVPPAPAPLPRL